ncbi:hypothetical protein HAX54_000176 [Datura stramonium]|uniref:Uncharacterized protein n=1 Tax=Datura stramonium TaxID=4076 RepID=A0ABS8T0P1_DATST|nr:hypothetical protein [Datura stramonium]
MGEWRRKIADMEDERKRIRGGQSGRRRVGQSATEEEPKRRLERRRGETDGRRQQTNEAQGTTGWLNDPIKPQWLHVAWPTGKFIAEDTIAYCLECKCCLPDHIPPN